MFKIGDKVRVINSHSMNHAREGVVTALGDGFSRVSFGTVDYYYSNTLLERMDDMDISERLSEAIKENQNLKQQLGEQNIKLNKIQADLNRELNGKGVSDSEIKVRDEVNDGNTVAIVTRTYANTIYVLYRDGSCGSHSKDTYTKTGKHYDSIDEFMNS